MDLSTVDAVLECIVDRHDPMVLVWIQYQVSFHAAACTPISGWTSAQSRDLISQTSHD